MDMDELKKKATDALPSDDQIEKAADKVQEHTPDGLGPGDISGSHSW